MQVLGIEEEALATCLDENGARHAVDVALVGTVGPGDSVLVHAGVALVRLESGALA
jgi:hydrogenase maturation factor